MKVRLQESKVMILIVLNLDYCELLFDYHEDNNAKPIPKDGKNLSVTVGVDVLTLQPTW